MIGELPIEQGKGHVIANASDLIAALSVSDPSRSGDFAFTAHGQSDAITDPASVPDESAAICCTGE